MKPYELEIKRSNQRLNQMAMSALKKLGKKKKSKAQRKLEKKKAQIPDKYRDYIKSKFWRIRKQQYFQKYGRKCLICQTTKSVQLHHIIYKDLGLELDENLVPFCALCHEEFHSIYPIKKDMMNETLEFIRDNVKF